MRIKELGGRSLHVFRGCDEQRNPSEVSDLEIACLLEDVDCSIVEGGLRSISSVGDISTLSQRREEPRLSGRRRRTTRTPTSGRQSNWSATLSHSCSMRDQFDEGSHVRRLLKICLTLQRNSFTSITS